jgi:HD-like signal output (HDOD) protein
MVAASAALLPALTDAIARRDFAIPAYPATALRLRRLIATDRYNVAQLSEVIATDPALVATVLGMANSPLYRPEGPPITALGRAVHRIGARTVATLATAAGVGAQACARGPLVDLKYTVWRRAVSCALISQKLAPVRGLDAEEAFLAGLLHGFGRTVAVACLEKLLGTNAPPRPLSLAEWLALTDEHRADLAKAVAERWELPSELAAAIGASPDSSSALAQLVALSEQLTVSLEHNGEQELPLQSDQEKRAFRELCALLPGAIAALVEAPEGNRPPPPSAIAKPATALKGEVREISLSVSDARASKGAALAATAISTDGLRLKSDRPFQEGCLVHLRLPRDAAPQKATHDTQLNLWVNVVLCAPDPGAFRVEVQLFSPSRELRAEWLQLFEAGRAAH